MTDRTFPFTIHCLDPRGLNVVTLIGADAITSNGVTLQQGESIEVTQAIRDANASRDGVSWVEWSDEEQIEHFGRLRFSVGELPQNVAKTLEAARLDKLSRERQFLLSANPALARATASALRLREIDAELGAKV